MSQAGIVNSAGGGGGGASSFVEDVGTAMPVGGVINFLGGIGITTSGSGSTVTITNTGVASNLTFHTDSTDAISSGNAITFHGAGGLTFSGSGSTVTGTISGFVTSVSGTTNRITSTGGTTPVIDISAAYVGQTSITTLGTIGIGIWQGTVIGSTYGGTGVNNGASTITLGGSLTTSGAFASTFTMTNTTNVTFPTSGTLATTSQLPSITATQYDVLVGGAANAIGSVGPGSAGQVLQSGGNAANPAYSTATYPSSSGGTGKILYDNGTNFIESTPTFPTSASATSRKIIVSDGTNWTASTETWAVPGSSGNVLTSDGTNWTSAAPAALTWSDKSSGFATAASNGYFITTTGTGTLPASPSQGNTISFIVDTTNLLTIQANTGQTIRIGNVISASAGTAVSIKQGDAVTLVYRSSDTSWIASSVIGTWTVT